MELRKDSLRLVCLLVLYYLTATTTLAQWDGRSPRQSKSSPHPHASKLPRSSVTKTSRKAYTSSDPSLGSPYCITPPITPLPPSTTLPSPIISIQPPPPPPFYYTPPVLTPNPPEFPPSPPGYEPSPPSYVPSPPEFVPGPPVFLPPVVYPLRSAPPPPYMKPRLWCVAKPVVPDPVLREATDYACEFGADCISIQPNGLCYQPDTVIAHASYAFNSYWQRTKLAGGACDFGSTAMLITVDPSYDGCDYNIY